MQARKPYLTNLNDTEWQILAPLIPTAKPGGRPEVYPKREIVNAILVDVAGKRGHPRHTSTRWGAWQEGSKQLYCSIGRYAQRFVSGGFWQKRRGDEENPLADSCV